MPAVKDGQRGTHPLNLLIKLRLMEQARYHMRTRTHPKLNSTQSQSRNLIVEAPYPNTPEKKYLWASPPLYIPTIRRFHRLFSLTPQSLALK